MLLPTMVHIVTVRQSLVKAKKFYNNFGRLCLYAFA
jgi:hypothetical protein